MRPFFIHLDWTGILKEIYELSSVEYQQQLFAYFHIGAKWIASRYISSAETAEIWKWNHDLEAIDMRGSIETVPHNM